MEADGILMQETLYELPDFSIPVDGYVVFVDSSVLWVKCSSARTSSCPGYRIYIHNIHKCIADLLQRYFSQGLGYSAITAGACAFRAIIYIDIHMVKL